MKSIYYAHNYQTAVLHKLSIKSRQDFINNLIKHPLPGTKKGGPYFVTANKLLELYRNNKNHLASFCVCLDIDESPITLKIIAERFKSYNYTLYSSGSHNPSAGIYKGRLILFCDLLEGAALPERHRIVVDAAYQLIPEIRKEKSSYVLSQMWFLPFDSPYYEYYSNLSGIDFQVPEIVSVTSTLPAPQQLPATQNAINLPVNSMPTKSIANHLDILIEGEKGTGINEAILAITANARKSSPEFIREIVRRLIPDPNKRQKDSLGEMDRALKGSYITTEDIEPPPIESPDTDYTTMYPIYSDIFEALVGAYMNYTFLPLRVFGIIGAEMIIGALTGRACATQYLGIGTSYNCLLACPSAEGKGSVSNFVEFVLEQIDPSGHLATGIISGKRFSSPYMMFTEFVRTKGSFISFQPDAGAMYQQKYGIDTLDYELNALVSSGPYGESVKPYIQRQQGKEDKFAILYELNPNILRESSYEQIKKADKQNEVDNKGLSGRRFHVNIKEGGIDPNKSMKKINLDPSLLKVLRKLFEYYKRTQGQIPLLKIKKDLWSPIRIDPIYADYLDLIPIWRTKSHTFDNEFFATQYRRNQVNSINRANRHALLINPDNPEITSTIFLDYAVKSWEAELKSMEQIMSSGDKTSIWYQVDKAIINIFSGKSGYSYPGMAKLKELKKEGIISWTSIKFVLDRKCDISDIDDDKLLQKLTDRMKSLGIHRFYDHTKYNMTKKNTIIFQSEWTPKK
ncbi:MAG: hypothetical protein GY834_10750 [Bacteroidetes bacterium]|nr:hypothetical protein [Bacteroidota bacterium]